MKIENLPVNKTKTMENVLIEVCYEGVDNYRSSMYAYMCTEDSSFKNENPTIIHPIAFTPGKTESIIREICKDIKVIFYTDMGWSKCMKKSLLDCVQNNRPFEKRKLDLKTIRKRFPFYEI